MITAKAKEKKEAGVNQYRPSLPLNSAEPVDTRKELANLAGVSRDTIAKAEKILKSPATKLSRMTRAGKVSINAAAEISRLPEDTQRELVNNLASQRTGPPHTRGKGTEKVPVLCRYYSFR